MIIVLAPPPPLKCCLSSDIERHKYPNYLPWPTLGNGHHSTDVLQTTQCLTCSMYPYSCHPASTYFVSPILCTRCPSVRWIVQKAVASSYLQSGRKRNPSALTSQRRGSLQDIYIPKIDPAPALSLILFSCSRSSVSSVAQIDSKTRGGWSHSSVVPGRTDVQTRPTHFLRLLFFVSPPLLHAPRCIPSIPVDGAVLCNLDARSTVSLAVRGGRTRVLVSF